MKIRALKALLAKLELEKQAVADARDEIREIYYAIEDLLLSLNVGTNRLDNGIMEIKKAIDAFSDVV